MVDAVKSPGAAYQRRVDESLQREQCLLFLWCILGLSLFMCTYTIREAGGIFSDKLRPFKEQLNAGFTWEMS